MNNKNNLIVSELEFDKIKERFIDFLKSDPKFNSYNFYGSGFDVLLDILSYNTYYMAFYSNFLANETFIDSANRRKSLTSKAKFLNYIPRSKTASIAIVDINVTGLTSSPPYDYIHFKKGTFAKSLNIDPQNLKDDNRTFVLADDLYLYNKSTKSGEYIFNDSNIELYEGNYITEKFLYDDPDMKFSIDSELIDSKTIRVRVYDSEIALGTSNYQSYFFATDFMRITGDSNVFFLTTNFEENYEIQFGNGVYGKKLPLNSIVEVTYIECNGEEGNNAKAFQYIGKSSNLDIVNLTNVDCVITTINPSDGGRERETLEELRFNLPNHYRRQNRGVTVHDYKEILIAEFPNISSISVWGGEDSVTKNYGKVLISIKPKFGDRLSTTAKEKILTILNKYNLPVIDPIILDPEYIYLELSIKLKYDKDKTDLTENELKGRLESITEEYNKSVNTFDGFFSNSLLNIKLYEADTSIISTFVNIKAFKDVLITSLSSKLEFSFSFEIVENSLVSETFMHLNRTSWFISNDKGEILIKWHNEDTGEDLTYSNVYGFIDYERGDIDISENIFDDENIDDLRFYCKPTLPDVFPTHRDIIDISKINVEVI